MKKTKIIATIGPATEQREVFEKLVDNGLNIARLNFSHGGFEEQLPRIQMIKAYREETGIPIGILLDTKGPEIRTKTFKAGEVSLVAGQQFTLTTREVEGDETICSITYEGLPQDVKVGDKILVNDGIIVLKVQKIEDTEIVCDVISGGTVKDKRGINVPGIKTQLPAITDKDIKDIEFGITNGVDFIAASFIRSAEGVRQIKDILKKNDASHINIVSKIECCEALENLDEIIEESYGIMVARGDLGVEIETCQIPIIQKMIIEKCNSAGKPVITATHMLDSMIHNPLPTRAEVTDVANAVYDGTDAVMLSGETTIGKYPVETVKYMSDIAKAAEEARKYDTILREKAKYKNLSIADTVSYATCSSAYDLNAKAIICPTASGFTAGMVSKFRPKAPIYAFVDSEVVQRKLLLYSGVEPILFNQQDNVEHVISETVNVLKERHFVAKDDLLVITAGLPYVKRQITNMMKIHIVE
ncbi:MAG: pyruvate kinase [Cellulosilyticaceae bacterium]